MPHPCFPPFTPPRKPRRRVLRTADLVRSFGAAAQPDIVAARRLLHRFPEVSGQEADTQKLLCEQLDELGIPYRKLGNNGIIATIAGTAPGAYNDADGAPVRPRRLARRHGRAARRRADGPSLRLGEPWRHARVRPRLRTSPCCSALRASLNDDAADAAAVARYASSSSPPRRSPSVRACHDSRPARSRAWTAYLRRAYLERGGRRHRCPARLGSAWPIPIGSASTSTAFRRPWLHAAQGRGCRRGGLPSWSRRYSDRWSAATSRRSSPLVVTVGEIHGGQARNIMAGSARASPARCARGPRACAQMVPERLEHLVSRIAHGVRRRRRSFTYRAGQRRPCQRPHVSAARAAPARWSTALRRAGALADYRGHACGRGLQPSTFKHRARACSAFVGRQQPPGGGRPSAAQLPLHR